MPDIPAPAIITDTPCIGCGYNIRSLELATRCPECGTPVDATLRGGLRYSPEPFLRRLLLATRCLSYGMLAYAVALIVIYVGAALLEGVLSNPNLLANPASAIGGRIMLATLVMTLPIVAMLAGYWFLTTPHPGIHDAQQPVTARVLTRIAVGLAAVVSLTGAVSTIVSATRTGVTANAFAATGMFWTCAGCLGFPLLLGLVLPPVHIVKWLCTLDRSEESKLLSRRAVRSYWLLPLLVFVGPLLGYMTFMVAVVMGLAATGAGFGGPGPNAPTPAPDDTIMIIASITGCGTAFGSLLAAMIYTWYVVHATGRLIGQSLADRYTGEGGDDV
jgi:hypothetical protein